MEAEILACGLEAEFAKDHIAVEALSSSVSPPDWEAWPSFFFAVNVLSSFKYFYLSWIPRNYSEAADTVSQWVLNSNCVGSVFMFRATPYLSRLGVFSFCFMQFDSH